MSEDELVATVILLLNAGHEATVQAIGNGVKTMLEEGVDARLAFADESATAATVEEAAAVRPAAAPVSRATRWKTQSSPACGFRKGDRIGLLLGAANRDPARFPHPDVFDGRRSPNPHVSFGAGIHFCVGAPLARLELTRRAADPVRPPAGLAPRRAAALSRRVPFSWARGAEGRMAVRSALSHPAASG